MARRIFALRPTMPRVPFGFADVALLFGLFLLIYELGSIGRGFFAEFRPPLYQPRISLDPAMLPYYAARSTMRMFIALGLSILFTLSYGYAAAKNRRAEQVLIPTLDILQSVPVLAFLAIVTDMFIGMFPGSLLGLEMASIFAVFTGQAWNMTFSFYHSLVSLPRDLDDAAKVFRMSKWRRFLSVEVPSSMIGLVWNAMMSFGGGWFFVVFTETIEPTPPPGAEGGTYLLPGLGSYVKTAMAANDSRAILYASLTMLVVILIVDQFFWRPVVAWSEKFKMEISTSGNSATSWLLDLIYAAHLPKSLNKQWRKVVSWYRKTPVANLHLPRLSRAEGTRNRKQLQRVNWDIVYGAALGALIVYTCFTAARFVTHEVRIGEILVAFKLGCFTLIRVLVLLVFASIVWTPVGVWIGSNPKMAKFSQPIVQFLSSFPANFLFPAFITVFIKLGIHLNFGSIILMALGTQWYVLFNSIAGAMSIPTDLKEMASNLGMKGWVLWKRLILPAIFPAWVTGAITASGGAWNASIVAEITDKWGSKALVADGLGSYIVLADRNHDFPRLVLGVSVMCVFVVALNRLVWRRLYRMAETRYRIA